jgi:K+ transporter
MSLRRWRRVAGDVNSFLFAAMVRNAGSIVDYFNIPPNRVIELGTQVEI